MVVHSRGDDVGVPDP